jgi:hypothetical protein
MDFCRSLWQEINNNITTFKDMKGTWIGMQFDVNLKAVM